MHLEFPGCPFLGRGSKAGLALLLPAGPLTLPRGRCACWPLGSRFRDTMGRRDRNAGRAEGSAGSFRLEAHSSDCAFKWNSPLSHAWVLFVLRREKGKCFAATWLVGWQKSQSEWNNASTQRWGLHRVHTGASPMQRSRATRATHKLSQHTWQRAHLRLAHAELRNQPSVNMLRLPRMHRLAPGARTCGWCWAAGAWASCPAPGLGRWMADSFCPSSGHYGVTASPPSCWAPAHWLLPQFPRGHGRCPKDGDLCQTVAGKTRQGAFNGPQNPG